MRNLAGLSSLAFLLLVCTAVRQPVAAQVPAGERVALAGQLLDLSDQGAVLARVHVPNPEVVATLEAEATEQVPAFQEHWARSFEPEMLRRHAEALLARRAPADSLALAAAWLSQPTVQEAMTHLRDGRSPAGQEAFQRWLEDLDDETVDDDRLALVDQIVERVGDDNMILVPLTRLAAGLRVAFELAPEDQRFVLRSALDHVAAEPVSFAAHMVVVERLFVYHALAPLATADLDIFVASLDSPEARWYHETVFGVLEDVLADAVTRAVSGVTG